MPKKIKTILLGFLLTLGLVAGWMALPAPAQAAFDIKQGIVGNLGSEACRLQGNCDWCDFIDLMVVLQKVILSLFGVLALFMFVWAGQGLIMAGGNEEKIAGAKKIITATMFGVLTILGAYFLIHVVIVVLVTPLKGSQPISKIFDFNWSTAGCTSNDKNSEQYCRFRNRGESCGQDSYCMDNQCVVKCSNLPSTSSPYTCKTAVDCQTDTEVSQAYCEKGQVCCLPKK